MDCNLPPYMEELKEGILVRVHCQPRARRPGVAGTYGTSLKLKLNAPPVDGKANKEAQELLSRIFRCPKRHIDLRSGRSSRDKAFLITGLYLEDIKRLIKEKRIP